VANIPLNVWTLGLIIVAHFRTLAAIHARAFIGMLSLVAASMGAGWLLGETGSENRKAMGFSTSVRNVAVSLVVATSSFPGTPAVTAALVYGLLQTVALGVIATAWGRLGASEGPSATEAIVDAGQLQ
jgi:predicted Na+-dependent transporter